MVVSNSTEWFASRILKKIVKNNIAIMENVNQELRLRTEYRHGHNF